MAAIVRVAGRPEPVANWRDDDIPLCIEPLRMRCSDRMQNGRAEVEASENQLAYTQEDIDQSSEAVTE